MRAMNIYKNLFKGFLFSNNNVLPEKVAEYFLPILDIGELFGGKNTAIDFAQVPELNAILNARAKALSSWKLEIVSKATQKPIVNELSKIIGNPNWFQSQIEYWRQSSLFRDIYGNEFIYFLKPLGMSSIKGQFTLDPTKIEIEYTGSKLFFLESNSDNVKYYYKHDGQKTPLDAANIIHLNDNRVKSDTFLRGTSKLEALQPAIKNIRAAYKKRGIILNMPIGILSNGNRDSIGQAMPMNPDDKKTAQIALKTHGAAPILTSLAVNYADMNINANSMGLFEEVKEDTAKICDAYGYPYELLANQKGSTFTNLKEANKQFYENTVIPDADERIKAINMYLETENKTWELKASFDHLAVFNEDKKERALSLRQTIEALSKAYADGAMSIEQYKKELLKFNI